MAQISVGLNSPALKLASEKAIIASRKYIAKTREFATDFSAEAVAPMTTLAIPVYNGKQANDFDESTNNYGNTDGSTFFVEVKFEKHPKTTFSFSDKEFTEYNSSSVWTNAGKAAGEQVGKAIFSAVTGAVSATNMPATHTLSGSTMKKKIANLRKACADNNVDPTKCVVLLDPTNFGDLIGELDDDVYGGPEAIRDGIIRNLYGFKSVIEATEPFGDTSAKGAIVPEDAIVIASKVLPADSAAYTELGYEQDAESGLTLGYRRFTKPETGRSYATVECLFGVGVAHKYWDDSDSAPVEAGVAGIRLL